VGIGRGRGHRYTSYARSKLANSLFALELQRRLRDGGGGTDVFTVSPGRVATNIFESIQPAPLRWAIKAVSALMHQTPAQVSALMHQTPAQVSALMHQTPAQVSALMHQTPALGFQQCRFPAAPVESGRASHPTGSPTLQDTSRTNLASALALLSPT
jgi:NAD(P)-dependent dehydrogenase (short-subunit alcohol dehydrogenase family)